MELIPREERDRHAREGYEVARQRSAAIASQVAAGTCSDEIREAFEAGQFAASLYLAPKVSIGEKVIAAARARERTKRLARGFDEHPMALWGPNLASEVKRMERQDISLKRNVVVAKVGNRHGIGERECYRRAAPWLQALDDAEAIFRGRKPRKHRPRLKQA